MEDLYEEGTISTLGEVGIPDDSSESEEPATDDGADTAADDAGDDPDGQSATDPEEAKNTGKTADTDRDDTDANRFDKHPRFQKLIADLKEARAELQQYRESAPAAPPAQSSGQPEQPASEDPGYIDIQKFSDEEIQDLMADRPKDFLLNFGNQVFAMAKQQIKDEITKDMTAKEREAHEKAEAERLDQSLRDYASKNDDFVKMYQSGELGEFMAKNPGHTYISAHMSLTRSEKAMRERLEAEIRKDYEEKHQRNLRARRSVRVLNGSGAGGPKDMPDDDDVLKDSKKFGGPVAVLADRLAQRRRASARG